MITNLFSVFDPSTPYFSSSNWLSIFILLRVYPSVMWVTKNRNRIAIFSIFRALIKELKPLINKTRYIILIILSIFLYITLNNLIGLFPYIFTASRHIRLTLRIALPTWVSLIIVGWLYNSRNLLIHLIPKRTPYILIPVIVIIETIRNVIRPVTLAIRLAANIIAGHLLIVLVRSTIIKVSLTISPIVGRGQTILTLLEAAVALIQAYVFRVLVTLYCAEFTS